jgi:hypothetical protein
MGVPQQIARYKLGEIVSTTINLANDLNKTVQLVLNNFSRFTFLRFIPQFTLVKSGETMKLEWSFSEYKNDSPLVLGRPVPCPSFSLKES